MLTVQQKFSAAFLRVTDARSGWAPYFAAMLNGFIRREVPGFPTLAVTKDGALLWGTEFVQKHTVEEIAAGLMHEAMHVMLKIWERGAALGVTPEPTPDKRAKSYLLNIAHDACINGELRKMGHVKLPDAWIYPESLEQPEGWILEQRYNDLIQRQQQQQQGGNDGEGDGPDAGGDQQGKPGVGEGWCGSCASHPVPSEPPPEKGKSEGRSEAEMDRFRRETAEAIKHTAAKNPGSVPDSLQRWADEMLAPAKIDWRTRLARTVRAAVAYRPGAVDFTWSKPSRRQAGIGFGVGRAVVPAYHAPQPQIGIVVDTSGSMSQDDLALAMSETQGVLLACGASVSMVAVDCEVQADGVKPISTIQDALKLLKGGGGTDMTVGFQAFESQRTRPQVMIVFTDGHIGNGYPDSEPKWCRTLWIVVGEGGNVSCCPWGEIVHVDESGAREAA